jgi:hypothetical protein
MNETHGQMYGELVKGLVVLNDTIEKGIDDEPTKSEETTH